MLTLETNTIKKVTGVVLLPFPIEHLR